jgi:glucosylceramidase
MPKTLWGVISVELVALLMLGCNGAGGRDIAGEVCGQAASCNSLSGATSAQCKAMVTKSLGAMTSAARTDAEKALDACLAAGCGDLSTCIEGALTGQSAGAGGSTGGGGSSGGNGGRGAGGSPGGSSGGSGGNTTAGSGGNTTAGSGGNAMVGSGGNTITGGGGAATTGGGGSAGGGQAGNSAGGSPADSTGGRTGGNVGGSGGGNAGGAAGGQPGATGGGTGTGSTEPELMTSAQNAYWTKGQVTKVTSGTADVNVDKNTTYQRWDGFGGTFNEMGWDALSVVSAEIPNAIKYLFDAQDGANFVHGRIPLGASDYAMSWYTLDDTAGDYAMDKFSIARDKEKLIPFIKEALKLKPDLHLWASPWVVPSWMMDGSSNMKSDAQTLAAHALYMARFVEDYAKEGLKISAIHPQNEPGYARVHWTQSLFINFIKTYLGPKFAERNLTAEIWCGTMSKDPDDTNIAKTLANDADAMKYVKGFGVQWNLQPAVATLALKAPVMQTEHTCGNYNFDTPYWKKGQYNAQKAPNDHAYGEESWQLIRDWIVAGVNSYSAWNMVLDNVGKSLDGWPQDALLVVDRTAKTLTRTAAYYAFRHYASYIAVGATRIGTSGSNDAVAFKNPDGSFIIEVYNKNASAKKMIVGVGSALSQALYQFDVPAHGWATLRVMQ